MPYCIHGYTEGGAGPSHVSSCPPPLEWLSSTPESSREESETDQSCSLEQGKTDICGGSSFKHIILTYLNQIKLRELDPTPSARSIYSVFCTCTIVPQMGKESVCQRPPVSGTEKTCACVRVCVCECVPMFACIILIYQQNVPRANWRMKDNDVNKTKTLLSPLVFCISRPLGTVVLPTLCT